MLQPLDTKANTLPLIFVICSDNVLVSAMRLDSVGDVNQLIHSYCNFGNRVTGIDDFEVDSSLFGLLATNQSHHTDQNNGCEHLN